MDHAINSLRSFWDVIWDMFYKEQKEGNHKRFSDNPYYEELKVLTNAMNILRKYEGWEPISIKREFECLK